MGVRLKYREGTLTAFLSGEIDDHVAKTLREEIDATAEKVRPVRLRLDFAEVPFMDSSGIGLIIGRYKLLCLWNGKLILANLLPRVEMMVRLSGADKLAVLERREECEGVE
ncbi:anti-sigma factor antagonist [Yeguia hominis]|uniref:Anti-sigma factor antagonist n=1 Tax=Yeguia hominis TaxID=2763662 RepID=A0A926D6J0_9FIRM|nr:STAS domain-containing protein [Yeguia hominis]